MEPIKADSQVCLDEPPEFNQVHIQRDRNFTKLLMRDLESFVRKAQDEDDLLITPMQDQFGNISYQPSLFAKLYFKRIPDFVKTVNLLPSTYAYDDFIDVFITCCNELNLFGSSALLSDEWNAGSNAAFHAVNAASINTYNELVNLVKAEGLRRDLSKGSASRIRASKRNFRDYCSYISNIFAVCSRLVVLRIDLFYKKSLTKTVDIYQAQTDIDHLVKNKRHNSIFGHMKGYIVKMEYGIDKGIHFHTLILFDGSRRSNHSHIHIAQSIGKYWVDVITKGRGDYWNSNAKIKDFKDAGLCGIGTINADETILRNNLLNHVVKYLCKPSQFFKPKSGPRVRLYRKGNNPRIPTVKRGKKRTRHQNRVVEQSE